MARRIGLPFLLLAAGSPLIQHWFSRSASARERDPYRLYVASNLGSFAALLAYPLAIEPWMTLRAQSRRWTIGYVLLIVLTFTCGLAASRGADRAPARIAASQPGVVDRSPLVARTRRRSVEPPARRHDAHLDDLAPRPLLWIVPLALYLLTFVVAFGAPRQWLAPSVHAVVPYVVITIAILLFFRGEIPGPAGYAVHALAFFVCALALPSATRRESTVARASHGVLRLAVRRRSTRRVLQRDRRAEPLSLLSSSIRSR
jgi:hypothetical protein